MDNLDVAIRSSATSRGPADASFAGQPGNLPEHPWQDECSGCLQEVFCKPFYQPAISYRHDKGSGSLKFPFHCVQKMVRSDSAYSGVIFTIDTESGFKDAVFITGAYGLGENVVQGR